MNRAIYEKNMNALRSSNGELFRLISLSESQNSVSDYVRIEMSATDKPVPFFSDGVASHSLRDPAREAERFADTIPQNTFILFGGLAGGYHIRAYLDRDADARCAVFERNSASLRTLFSLVDFSDILECDRVSLAVVEPEGFLTSIVSRSYLPARSGSFSLQFLRSWKDRFNSPAIENELKKVLRAVSADYSVQAHFGRLWLRNIVENLALAETIIPRIPQFDVRKTAIITAAGPSLEDEIAPLNRERDSLVIFATDTSRGTLTGNGIVPDIYVSVDPQNVSSYQAMSPFSPKTTVLVDLAGNPQVARRAIRDGASLLFVSGGHPLTDYAASYGFLPPLDASSGTVTLAARSAALSLGFRDIRFLGADFKYSGGKPYARGTYLADRFDSSSTRFAPAETCYSGLMFRSPVTAKKKGMRIDYYTEVLDRYGSLAAQTQRVFPWPIPTATPFPAKRFLREYTQALRTCLGDTEPDQRIVTTVLPFAAWARNQVEDGQFSLVQAFRLALELIERYTVIP